MKASKAVKTVTAAANLSKHACSGAKHGLGAPFRLALGSFSPGFLHQHVHCCIDKVEHHGSPSAQLDH